MLPRFLLQYELWHEEAELKLISHILLGDFFGVEVPELYYHGC